MTLGRRASLALRLMVTSSLACSRTTSTSTSTSTSSSSGTNEMGPAPDDAAVVPRKGMVWIPAGTLLAGTTKDKTPRVADEELEGEPVELAGFYIDEFSYPNEAGGIPKSGITRDEAIALCAALDKRLCTELEWERACKGPGNTTYEYGDSYRAAECGMGQPGRLTPSGLHVGCKSGFGVHDLHGGPWQWTASMWRRGGDSQAGTVRGGNSDSGELVGRCANAMPAALSSRRPDFSVRCCAGEANTAEVKLVVKRAKTLERVPFDRALASTLADAVTEKSLADLPADQAFRIDRIWRWHPIGNEELLVAAGCARRPVHLACGVGIFRPLEDADAGTAPAFVDFAASGWWMAVVKADHRGHDLWVYGGDGAWSFRRRVAYVWGRIAIAEAEKALPHGLSE